MNGSAVVAPAGPDKSGWRLGIDVGGTFTDFVLLNDQMTAVIAHKVPSSPEDPASSIAAGLQEIAARHGIVPSTVGFVGHGSTVATNTLLERKGIETGLLVTEGFVDILTIGRVAMPNVADLQGEKAPPIVPPHLVRGVRERIGAGGAVLQPLDVEQLTRVAWELVNQGVEAIAVCFLHADRYPKHEKAAKRAITAAIPAVPVWTSSQVWPEIREYERALLTAISAYIGPRVKSYYRAIERTLITSGPSTLLIAQGNGGMASAEVASSRPASTLQSGPAAGVAAAEYTGRLAGRDKLIALDIGGTSTDVAIIDGGLPHTTEARIGDFSIMLPMVDVASIGAGGGSIAWIDPAGSLQVGPSSAGADPGPACYRRGGSQSTLTDAYLVAGMLDPTAFRAGSNDLDLGAAFRVLGALGKSLSRDPEDAAQAVIDITTSKMYAEVARIAGKKGIDLRDFTLMAYGGAGPTHAMLLALELGIDEVLIPRMPGVLCALGCITSDVRADFVQTASIELGAHTSGRAWRRAAPILDRLEQRALRWIKRQGLTIPHQIQSSADMRYLGQSFSVTVPIDRDVLQSKPEGLVTAFHDMHEATFAHADRSATIEVVALRLTLIAAVSKPQLAVRASESRKVSPRAFGKRRRSASGKSPKYPLILRSELNHGDVVEGPIVVSQYDSTVFIPAQFSADVDGLGNLAAHRRLA